MAIGQRGGKEMRALLGLRSGSFKMVMMFHFAYLYMRGGCIEHRMVGSIRTASNPGIIQDSIIYG